MLRHGPIDSFAKHTGMYRSAHSGPGLSLASAEVYVSTLWYGKRLAKLRVRIRRQKHPGDMFAEEMLRVEPERNSPLTVEIWW